MKRVLNVRAFVGLTLAALGTFALVFAAVSCNDSGTGFAPTPFLVQGPGFTDNEPPTLVFVEPIQNVTSDQGSVFLIRWTDSDRDSNATISLFLINTETSTVIPLVAGLAENDTAGPDRISIGTSPIAVGQYNLFAIIDDGVNPPVTVFALQANSATNDRVAITVVPPGQGRPTQPPQISVLEPRFDQSVAQDDILRISVQPSALLPDVDPFDGDSDVTLFILLDTDLLPSNDDPANPGDDIIVLRQQVIPANTAGTIEFEIPIDLTEVPPRPGGLPYFIRATADDLSNPRVHQYAVGKISVVTLASGCIDLDDVGKTIAGALFYGFNPGAQTGFTADFVGDFDSDSIDDFVLVSRFGNPRNVGLVGEAYLIYGQDRVRFGGAIAVNSVAETVNGVIFEAPPVRLVGGSGQAIPGTPRSDGITSVDSISDLSGDGRPELLFGLPRVFGAFDSMDYDPGDDDPQQGQTEQIAVDIRQGQVTTDFGNGVVLVDPNFSGVSDLTINSADPNSSSGTLAEIRWQNDPANGVTQWGLIKFSNVLSRIPDADNPEVIDIGTISGNLDLRVFNTGGSATVHQVLRAFDEQTTFSTFAAGGGAPVAGVDYVADQLATLAGDTAQIVQVNIGEMVRLLIDGQLAPFGNEIRLIIVPDATGAENESAVRSSETGLEISRPTLRIGYTRASTFGANGCYPDLLVNNRTDADPALDLYSYAGGMAVMVNSQNRDNEGLINPDRLESTVVTLELVGQENWVLGSGGRDPTGGISGRASNVNALGPDLGNEQADPSRISGARFAAGAFDTIDHLRLRQPPRDGLFGQTVSSIGDLGNDGLSEIVISAPRNERYLADLLLTFGFQSTHLASTVFDGSIVVLPGNNYNLSIWRDLSDATNSTSTIPILDQQRVPPFGSCPLNDPRGFFLPADTFQVFAEDIDDMLGGASSAGDFNQDGLDDILCGAYKNNRADLTDTGAVYIIYGRNVIGDFRLSRADDVLLRPPMLRIRGVKPGDQVGWRQKAGLDVNGDRLDDVFIGAPNADFGGVTRSDCGDNLDNLSSTGFSVCRARHAALEEDLFSDDTCKVFDFDNDFDIDDDDQAVFDCLVAGGTDCCNNLVNNGFVGVVFGGVFVDGDRDITQIGTPDLPGVKFFGSGVGHRAGYDISSAGDFNQDGFGDLLITVPGELSDDRWCSQPECEQVCNRLGVVYLIFGGPHLERGPTEGWSLSQVGSAELPGIIFISPETAGRPNEAAPIAVGLLGDINNDGFDDIFIGNPKADFVDPLLPQLGDVPASDPQVGRRRNAGKAYIVYGNNFGSNRLSP